MPAGHAGSEHYQADCLAKCSLDPLGAHCLGSDLNELPSGEIFSLDTPKIAQSVVSQYVSRQPRQRLIYHHSDGASLVFLGYLG